MELPNILYKYRYFEDMYSRSAIEDNILFFSSPIRFNDPFDCTIPFRYDLADPDLLVDRFRHFASAHNPYLNRDTLRKRYNPKKVRKLLSDRTIMKGFYDFQKELFYKNIGVLSLTADCMNILMWSHYSQNHTGFCIGYFTDELITLSKSYYKSDNYLITHGDVKYRAEYPKLFPRSETDIEILEEMVLYKSILWDYEDEYRFVLNGTTDKTIKGFDSLIAKVILGCRISDGDKSDIIDTLRSKTHRPRLVQAIQSKSTFGLDFEEIEY